MALTHIPAFSTHHPDRYENGDGRGYDVVPDDGAEDPRRWIEPQHAGLWAFREPHLSRSVVADRPEGNIALDAFAHYIDRFDAETALELTRRWLRIFHPTSTLVVDIATISGYSQGDWLDVVAAVAEGYGTPESHLDQLRQWAFGDVWVVIPDDKPAVGGIYADSAEEAVDYYRNELEDEAESLSPASASTRSHIWKNSLPAAIADVLTEREEPEADVAVRWLEQNESSSDVLWDLLNRIVDEIQTLANRT